MLRRLHCSSKFTHLCSLCTPSLDWNRQTTEDVLPLLQYSINQLRMRYWPWVRKYFWAPIALLLGSSNYNLILKNYGRTIVKHIGLNQDYQTMFNRAAMTGPIQTLASTKPSEKEMLHVTFERLNRCATATGESIFSLRWNFFISCSHPNWK